MLSRTWPFILLVACSRDEAPEVPASVAPASVAPASAAAPRAASPAEAAARDRALGAVRMQAFERHGAVPLPSPMPDAAVPVHRLVPTDLPTRVVGFELMRDMELAKPAPGRTRVSLVFIAPATGEQATAALRLRLEAEGWLKPGEPLGATLRNGAGDRLEHAADAADDRPARVTLTLTLNRPPGALPEATKLAKPRWLAATPTPFGYEFGHFHGVRGGTAVTDVERLALAFRTADAAAGTALIDAVTKKAREMGYTPDAKDPRLLRHADGETLTARLPGPEPGDVVLHHQRRWKR